MVAIAFDTLAYSQTRQRAGMAQEQADALAKAQKTALDEMLAAKELATQADIFRLEAKMEANKHEILKWLIGSLFAQTALLASLFAYINSFGRC